MVLMLDDGKNVGYEGSILVTVDSKEIRLYDLNYKSQGRPNFIGSSHSEGVTVKSIEGSHIESFWLKPYAVVGTRVWAILGANKMVEELWVINGTTTVDEKMLTRAIKKLVGK